jgi:hypothetical protein
MSLAAVAPRAPLMTPPATRFARSGDARIAYQVIEQSGDDRPLDLLVVPGLVSHLGLVWEKPGAGAVLPGAGAIRPADPVR